ncbi:DrmB family protein [Pedobacter sp. MC2016-05]|uniref:DrmB family protein n=1 Tax=Pedobacter sp. MC2016-05 TaxID=2994474 RepID=UPI003A522EDF
MPDEGNHVLTYEAKGSSGDLASLVIRCSCGALRSLAGLLNVRKSENGIFDSALARIGLQGESFSDEDPNNANANGYYCTGSRPWLWPNGSNAVTPCGEHLQVLIRGGSNIHYPNVISAIYLPDEQYDLHPAICLMLENYQSKGIDGRAYLKMLFDQDGTGEILKMVLSANTEPSMFGTTPEGLLPGIKKLWETEQEIEDGADETVIDLRRQEYRFFLDSSKTGDRDLKTLHRDIADFDGAERLSELFDDIVLIEKMKETRVFTGFSRIVGGNFAPNETSAELSSGDITWLPAVEVFGEGIFLNFSQRRLDLWLAQSIEGGRDLMDRYHRAMERRNPVYEPRPIDWSFVMMHTFAHLLIKRLCFNCGYGSSALREKIYFSNEASGRMSGILIYTSSGDSEGSMGGLVRQGKEKNLFKLVNDAIEDAKWCSADPVCSEIGQSAGQGPDNTNASACHNCAIVPETSCEEFNVLLDRATIVGTMDGRFVGYFDIDLKGN